MRSACLSIQYAASQRFFLRPKENMRTHETTIGEGNASVICHYEFDSDGDLDALQVLFNGVDIVDALSDQQMGLLEDICRAAAKADYENTRYDAAIDAHIERMTA